VWRFYDALERTVRRCCSKTFGKQGNNCPVSVLKEIGGGSFIQIRRMGKCGLCNFKGTVGKLTSLQMYKRFLEPSSSL
jgi:hypothetical protein